jgi:SpoVK/Ycf46/Vps4 family AAA+-type ATPase
VSQDLDTSFDDVVGLDNFKEYYARAVKPSAKRKRIPKLHARGCFLVGLTGTGKSLAAIAAGNSCTPSRPTLIWDVGKTGSQWVSAGAHKITEVTDIMERMAPCNVQMDEAGKAKKASASEQGGGSETQAGEMDQIWLRWHQTSKADVYPIVTANQEILFLARKVPEYIARFDKVFFMDFPSREQKDQIWQYHMVEYELLTGADELYDSWYEERHKYGLDRAPTRLVTLKEIKSQLRVMAEQQYFDMFHDGEIPDDVGWVGRDIDSCCREAAPHDTPLTEVQITLSVKMAKQKMDELRDFAEESGWVDANHIGETYQKARYTESQIAGSGRKVVRRKKKRTAV